MSSIQRNVSNKNKLDLPVTAEYYPPSLLPYDINTQARLMGPHTLNYAQQQIRDRTYYNHFCSSLNQQREEKVTINKEIIAILFGERRNRDHIGVQGSHTAASCLPPLLPVPFIPFFSPSLSPARRESLRRHRLLLLNTTLQSAPGTS